MTLDITQWRSQPFLHGMSQSLARRRQSHSTMPAGEERGSQVALERGHVLADCGLAHCQFLRGGGKSAVARRRLKYDKSSER